MARGPAGDGTKSEYPYQGGIGEKMQERTEREQRAQGLLYNRGRHALLGTRYSFLLKYHEVTIKSLSLTLFDSFDVLGSQLLLLFLLRLHLSIKI